ncbi:MAG: hypothetical protein HZA88_15170 [Verrucomicrobia bacterium]|nr:hypothetical protein [Verrucomicrobiota bacterium]
MPAAPNRLIVVVSGSYGTEKDWEPLLKRLQNEKDLREDGPAAKEDNYRCKYMFWCLQDRWSWFRFRPRSRLSANDLARALCVAVEHAVSQGQYEDVILLAHSAGGVLARRAFLIAAESTGAEQCTWHSKVSRIVLLAALNRGWNPSCFSWKHAGATILRISGIFRSPFLRDLRRGSDFITNLRLQWLLYFRSTSSDHRCPIVVQVRGDVDEVVAEEDSEDINKLPQALLIDIDSGSGIGHGDLYRVDRAKDPGSLYQDLLKALICNVQYRQPPLTHALQRKKVVFILHGIRAYNYGWAQQLDNHIHRLDPSAVVVRPTYGFLSALGFALPFRRRANISWFFDQYSDLVAQHDSLDPALDFHFAGHSNGTYILGEGLRRLGAMRFHRVFLAGSVLPRDFPWRLFLGAKQVARVRNARSSRDVPVAVLCSILRGLFMRDVGTGGFDGFNAGADEQAFFNGGHSAPVESANLDNVAQFLLAGSGGPPLAQLQQCCPTNFFRWLSRFAPWAVYLILAGVLLCAAKAFGWLDGGWPGVAAWVGYGIFWLIGLLETW